MEIQVGRSYFFERDFAALSSSDQLNLVRKMVEKVKEELFEHLNSGPSSRDGAEAPGDRKEIISSAIVALEIVNGQEGSAALLAEKLEQQKNTWGCRIPPGRVVHDPYRDRAKDLIGVLISALRFVQGWSPAHYAYGVVCGTRERGFLRCYTYRLNLQTGRFSDE